jgi:hypothetical protein
MWRDFTEMPGATVGKRSTSHNPWSLDKCRLWSRQPNPSVYDLVNFHPEPVFEPA